MKPVNSKSVSKDFLSMPLMVMSELCSNHVEKFLTLTSLWDLTANQKELPSSSSASDLPWMPPLNSLELNTTEDKSRSKKPEEEPLQRETPCQDEERASVAKEETQDQSRPTPISKPQPFSSVAFHSTQPRIQLENFSLQSAKSNQPEL